MGGGGRASGQAERVRRRSGEGGSAPDASSTGGWDYNTATQTEHNDWSNVADVRDQLGVSYETARRLYDDVRDFTGSDSDDIRAAQRGDPNVWNAAEYLKKARSCEELIDRSPKWNGGELTRGLHGLDEATMKSLTTVGAVANCNYGVASWTTLQSKAEGFAGHYDGSLVMHVTGSRRATSINGISHYKNIEWEVLGSSKEAFECIRTEKRGNTVHAYYRVIDFDYDWGFKK